MVSLGLREKPHMTRDNSIGWSHTSVGTFQNCQRQYYLEKVDPKWMPLPPETISELKVLRSAKSLPILIGDSVHRSIAEHFRYRIAGRDADEGDFMTNGSKMLTKVLQTSIVEEKRQMDEKSYESKVEKAQEKVEVLLKAFWELPYREDVGSALQSRPDRSFVDPIGIRICYGEFRIGDFKGYAPPDLVYSPENEHYEILSWKTGIHHVDGFLMQLAGQTLFCINSFDLPAGGVVGKVINLSDLTAQPVEIEGNSEVIHRCLERMKREVSGIAEKFHDPSKKVPRQMEDFSLATSQNTCTKCKFKSICKGPE